MLLNTLFCYVTPYGILLMCNIRLCFELRKIMRKDKKNFKKIQIGKTLCKLKQEITSKFGIEMEEINAKNDPSTVKKDEIEVSSIDMTDKGIETSMILEANERIAEMYVPIHSSEIRGLCST